MANAISLELDTHEIDLLIDIRHRLHRQPELLYDLPQTSAFVEQQLNALGCDEVLTGYGECGVVGIIRGSGGRANRIVGLRADMDALPLVEATEAPWASEHEGRMHACGHDGHMTMLLGAARHLCANRDRFDGTVAVIFQPAEEGGAGAQRMLDDGLLEKVPLSEIYGMHNLPGLEIGHFAMTPGPAMASVDEIDLIVKGRGGHGAYPETTVDPLPAAAAIIHAAQTIVARNLAPGDRAVVSLTTISGGSAFNVIPETVRLGGTVRALDPGVRDKIERRVREIAASVADGYGCTVEINYTCHYPVMINNIEAAGHALAAGVDVAGASSVDGDHAPSLAGEDFAFFLNAVPGAMIWIGNGPSAGLHNPEYDFNDAALQYGVAYWVSLVEARLPSAESRELD